jgi:hypothetical protein
MQLIIHTNNNLKEGQTRSLTIQNTTNVTNTHKIHAFTLN